MKAMESLHDLIEEAKLRALWWAVCVLFLSYFLSLTSQSMWMNVPIAIFALGAGRTLLTEVEFRRRVRTEPPKGYLAHLQRRIAADDPILFTSPEVVSNWTRKVDSPVIEAALDEFIGKLLKDFVVDLWYSSITPDKEAPELMRAVVKDVLGEIAQRAKEINLVDLLTRDMLKLIGDHMALYRRNHSAIGMKLMATLSLDARDERLRHHLLATKELHPALISPECEYKVLQQLMGGVLAVILRPQEVQCPLIRCISRELLTCLVMQPLMNLASPGYINELIELIFLSRKEQVTISSHQNDNAATMSGHSKHEHDSGTFIAYAKQEKGHLRGRSDFMEKATSNVANHVNFVASQTQSVNLVPQTVEWARVLDAARDRRTQVLAPENLENIWAKGRNYKRKLETQHKSGAMVKSPDKASGTTISNEHNHEESLGTETQENIYENSTRIYKCTSTEVHGSHDNALSGRELVDSAKTSHQEHASDMHSGANTVSVKNVEKVPQKLKTNKSQLKRSRSSSFLINDGLSVNLSPSTSEQVPHKQVNYMSLDTLQPSSSNVPEVMLLSQPSTHIPKIKCRVVGAYFEKIASKQFAVYSIAVTSGGNETWFVKRRYRNFERLHRHLKDIPNYALHLPPKRFLSSSIDDYFVHQRCILLDKYLHDLLSIANVAEQHEVWDFLSASSKNYSFGKPTSVMKTLAVNVDDAMDDIVRQFKGVSDGIRRKVVGSSDSSSSLTNRSSRISLYEEEHEQSLNYNHTGRAHTASDDESQVRGIAHEDAISSSQVNGWHSDNELNSKQIPPRIVKHFDNSRSRGSERSQQSEIFSETHSVADSVVQTLLEDPVGVPQEWSPPKLSVPLLELVDTIFQLKQKGWLRRQVFWISIQIVQLVMEDAIDDWLLRQIHLLRREDVIAKGINWLQDVLWPEGTFFIKVGNAGSNSISEEEKRGSPSATGSNEAVSPAASFEMQREAVRRAHDIKNMIFGGAPSTLMSLIGHRRYRRSAEDVYYFLQSTTCMRQLTYSVLELLLVTVFPELKDLILDIHNKAAY